MKVPVCADCGVSPNAVKMFLYGTSSMLLCFHGLFLAGRIFDKAKDGEEVTASLNASSANASSTAAEEEVEDTTFRILGNAVALIGCAPAAGGTAACRFCCPLPAPSPPPSPRMACSHQSGWECAR